MFFSSQWLTWLYTVKLHWLYSLLAFFSSGMLETRKTDTAAPQELWWIIAEIKNNSVVGYFFWISRILICWEKYISWKYFLIFIRCLIMFSFFPLNKKKLEMGNPLWKRCELWSWTWRSNGLQLWRVWVEIQPHSLLVQSHIPDSSHSPSKRYSSTVNWDETYHVRLLQ